MEVLEYLARRPGQVVGREELEAAVWRGRVVSYDAVTNAIIKLRKAFKDDPRHPRIIETLSKEVTAWWRPSARRKNVTKRTTPPFTIAPACKPETVGSGPGRGDRACRTRGRGWRALVWRSPWKATVGVGGDPSPLKSIAVLPFDNLSGDRDRTTSPMA